MVDNLDRMRHNIIAQHASVRRVKARSSQAPIISSPIDTGMSSSEAHASPPSFSRRIKVSPTQAPEEFKESEPP